MTGLEPATNYPNFKTFERQQGRVVNLPAGGHWEATWSIEVHDNAAGVAGVLAEIVSAASAGQGSAASPATSEILGVNNNSRAQKEET